MCVCALHTPVCVSVHCKTPVCVSAIHGYVCLCAAPVNVNNHVVCVYTYVVKQTSFEFTRPEIGKVVHEGVLPCRFGVLTFGEL
jgi:hypothetical protein